MNYSRKTNRYISYNGQAASFYEIQRLHQQPTCKQQKYYKYLYNLCMQNNIEPFRLDCETRVEYSTAIDNMIDNLQKAGVDIQHGKSHFTMSTTIKSGPNGEVITSTHFIKEETHND